MLGEKLGEFQDKVTGRRILSAAASMLCLALVLFPIANVRAAELQILAGGAMTGPLGELATQFESASGHKLVFRFGTTPELIKLATTGGPFDLGIVHYASDTPYTQARTLGARGLSYRGMDSTYASAIAVARRILQKENALLS